MFVSNPRLVFREIPEGLPIPGVNIIYDASRVVELDTVDICGGLLIKTLALSLDPYMRNRMRPAEVDGDMPAFELGNTITGFGVAVVLRSSIPSIPQGSHVYGFMPFENYSVFPSLDSNFENIQALGLCVLNNPHHLPWRYFLGIAGMTGQTAFYGLKDISDPKPGDLIYVSAASGAVGHVVVQLAKSLGLRVVASVGSDEKVALVKELGADHVFNWKKSDVGQELKAHGPIDIYFDNVGGPTLEAAIENAALNARFVICGMVSQYNTPMDKSYGIRNLWLINRFRIKMEGLVVIDWHNKYEEEFYDTVPALVASGQLRYLEHVYPGLEAAGRGLTDILTGKNLGKAVVVISDDAP